MCHPPQSEGLFLCYFITKHIQDLELSGVFSFLKLNVRSKKLMMQVKAVTIRLEKQNRPIRNLRVAKSAVWYIHCINALARTMTVNGLEGR